MTLNGNRPIYLELSGAIGEGILAATKRLGLGGASESSTDAEAAEAFASFVVANFPGSDLSEVLAAAAIAQEYGSIFSTPFDSMASVAPGSPTEGEKYINTSDGKAYIYHSGAWVGYVPHYGQLIELGTSNEAFRYSQEAQDSGTAWRPAYFAGGGPRGVGAPTDEPPGIENVSYLSRVTCLCTTGLEGSTAVLHFQRQGGTAGSPAAPLAGANFMSVGARAWDNVSGLFLGSSIAIEGVLTQDAGGGNAYPACYLSIETADSAGRLEAVRFTQLRHFLVGETTDAGFTMQIVPFLGSTDRGLIIKANSTGGGKTSILTTGEADNTMDPTMNATAAGIFVYKNGDTGRSINAGGTVNAAGADYADRETKSATCGTIKKGALVGYDVDGYLTDKFSLAIAFGIKSTDPSYVGGDRFHEAVGPAPESPEHQPIPPAPKPIDEETSTAEQKTAYAAAVAQHETDLAAWRTHDAQYQTAAAAYKGLRDAYLVKLKAVADTQDRIAKAGKVPCIVAGTVTVGGYIVAQAGAGDTIVGSCVAARPTDATAANVVGRVRVANPNAARIGELISTKMTVDPAWTAIVEVIQA